MQVVRSLSKTRICLGFSISDRQKRTRKMLINEIKSGVSAQAKTQMAHSQKDIF